MATPKAGAGTWHQASAVEAPFGVISMTIAATVLGVGVVVVNPSVATSGVLVAAALVALPLVVPMSGSVRLPRGVLAGALALGLLVEGLVIAAVPVIPDVGYRMLVLGVALLGAAATMLRARWRTTLAAVALGAHLLGMWWMLASAGVPEVDVILFQHDAASALLNGTNPYSIRYENIYFGEPVEYYAPELMIGDRLDFGFPYPPLSLLFALPSFLIAGDVRFGAAAAVTLTAAIVMTSRPSQLATGAAMLIALAPATQVLLHGGWTEPYTALLLASTVWLAVRTSRLTPVSLGLLVATKQYCAPAYLLGAVLLAATRRRIGVRRMVLIPIGVALVTVLPFAVWDWSALMHSTVEVQLIQPFRIDALSIPAQMARSGLDPAPSVLAFALGGLVLLAVLLAAPRTVTGFCFAVVATLLVFFLFNKQAFLNYYFFVLAGLVCGIATAEFSEPAPASPQAEHSGEVAAG